MRKSSRRRKRKDEDLITENDDLAHQLIEDMKQAAEVGLMLNRWKPNVLTFCICVCVCLCLCDRRTGS